MAAKKGEHRAIIAGGGITGLCLANMLERLGIDYILLEAYGEIAPQVGASIGLLPNSLRILDQLGCYNALRALREELSQTADFRGPDGKTLMTLSNLSTHMIKRHGYPILFIDRHMVLQVLYDRLEDKSKVLLNKRVTKVTISADKAVAFTADGSSYVGDILVGADGVHSFVRQEMWRIAAKAAPGYIPSTEQTAMPCDYGCIFGTSQPTAGIDPQAIHTVFNKNRSHLVIAGPGARVYWFLFVKFERTYHPNIPKFTKEDEEALAREHLDDDVTETVKFGDLYNRRMASVLTALPEYVLQKWYLGRIITIGDAAHKFHPLSGQGGNNAIETAAALTNALHNALQSHPDGRLTDRNIAFVFQQTQSLRGPSARQLVKEAHRQQEFEAMESPFRAWLACRVVPKLHLEMLLRQWSDPAVASVRLNALPVPEHCRFLPCIDELPHSPLRWKWALVLAVSLLFSVLAWIPMAGWPLPHLLSAACSRLLGAICPTFIAAEWSASGGASHWSALLPVYVVWTTEGYRNGNSHSPVSLPSLWVAASQFYGFGIVAPLYYFVSVFTTASDTYTRTTGRPIPVAVAKAVLVPTLPICVAAAISLRLDIPGAALALFLRIPLLVPLSALVSFVLPCGKKFALEMYRGGDVSLLRAAYCTSFLAAAIVHLRFSFHSWSSINTFGGLNVHERSWSGDGSKAATGFIAVFCWTLYSIYELRRLGYISTPQALKVAFAAILGQFIVGPTAAYACTWYWREGVVARLSS